MPRPGGRDARSSPVASPPPEYDPNSQVYHVSYRPSDPETVPEVIAESVAAIEDVDSTALPAVHDVVDPEAVDRLVASAGEGPAADGVVVEFLYAGYHVTVRPDEVRIRPYAGVE